MLRRQAAALACAAALALLGSGLTGCNAGPSDEACQQLMEHVVDLYAPHPSGEALSAPQRAELAAQKAEVIKQIGPKFLSECKSTLPRDQVECALKARTEADLAACEQG